VGLRGRKCSICRHPKRALLELGLVLGTPLRVLAARYDASVTALHNHRHNHLTAVQKAAYLTAVKPADVDLEALSRSESEGLLGALIGQRARLQQVVVLALEEHDLARCIQAERAITENLSLMAKLLGQLVSHHQVTHTSILISTDYIKLRQTIIGALGDHPEARAAVGTALVKLETDAAKDITESKKPLLLEAQPC
jgi:hypothetical protein